MKITFHTETYFRIRGLGIECWFPDGSDWRKLQVTIMIGSYTFVLAIGSKKRFDEITKLLRGAK